MTARELLEQSLSIDKTAIIIDATTDGVVVPDEHKQNRALTLSLSHRFKVPADIEFQDFAVLATLTFNGTPFRCRIPYLSMRVISGPGLAELPPPKKVEKPRHLRLVS